jgi:hypothetical protein
VNSAVTVRRMMATTSGASKALSETLAWDSSRGSGRQFSTVKFQDSSKCATRHFGGDHQSSQHKPNQQMQVHVEGYHEVEGHYRSHTVYELHLNHVGKSWTTRCRFSEVVRMHAALKRRSAEVRRHEGVSLPKLPSRVNLGLLDPCGDCFCCQRQQELERYLQEVVSFQSCLGEAIEELYNLLDVSPEIRAQILFPVLPLEESNTFRGASYCAPAPTRGSVCSTVSWWVNTRRPRGKRPQWLLNAVLFSWHLGEGIDHTEHCPKQVHRVAASMLPGSLLF